MSISRRSHRNKPEGGQERPKSNLPSWASVQSRIPVEPLVEPPDSEYAARIARHAPVRVDVEQLFSQIAEHGIGSLISLRPTEEELVYWRTEYRTRLRRRAVLLQQADGDAELQKQLMRRYRDDPVAWTNDFTWTRDPRWVGIEGMTSDWPFYMFPAQERLMLWLHEVQAQMTDGIIPKPRDMGGTEVIIKDFVHDWLFHPGTELGVGSLTEPYVRRGPPKALMTKVEYTINNLPLWMLPEGYDPNKHFMAMRVMNPENGSVIEGEIGKEIGRGDRKSRYMLDEAGFLPWPEATEAALSGTSRVSYWLSTIPPTGKQSHFGRKALSGTIPVFQWTWRDDPRKTDVWYKQMCKKYAHNPGLIAREVDMAWEVATEHLLMPPQWLKYCVDNKIAAVGPCQAGFDPAGERAENVLAFRVGPVVVDVDGWHDESPTFAAIKAIRKAEVRGADIFLYDESGLGQGIGGTYANLDPLPHVEYSPFVSSMSASSHCYADEPLVPAKLRFKNLRAEAYWALRMRCYLTFERFARGVLHPDHVLISLPPDSLLIEQMSAIQYHHTRTGHVIIDSKRETAGLSPDRADAVMMAFANPEAARRHAYPHAGTIFIARS